MSRTDLAPGLLLAAPSLRDPNFAKTVVLLGRHDGEGALGWVVNGKELASVSELFRTSGLFPKQAGFPEEGAFARAVRVGGPVAPATGWLVYRRFGAPLPGELSLGGELAVTGEVDAFNALAGGTGPQDFRVLLGCAGWAPGQLESEISAGAWLPAPVELDLILETDPDSLWDEAYRRSVGVGPAAFTSTQRGRA
jgi:putative transcriptional regulator